MEIIYESMVRAHWLKHHKRQLIIGPILTLFLYVWYINTEYNSDFARYFNIACLCFMVFMIILNILALIARHFSRPFTITRDQMDIPQVSALRARIIMQKVALADIENIELDTGRVMTRGGDVYYIEKKELSNGHLVSKVRMALARVGIKATYGDSFA